MLATTLDVGDQFAIIVTKDNNEGDDFWILICEESLAMVEEVSKVDYWGQEVYRRKQIVVGKYYKRQGHNLQSYILCGGGHGFIYSHLVITTKFNMLQLVKALG